MNHKIYYLKGDVTNPIHNETVICHIVNDINKMGSGVARALYEKWPAVKSEYHDWYNNWKKGTDTTPFELGNTIFVVVESGRDQEKYLKTGLKETRHIIVANMIAQHSIISMGEVKPIRYDALEKCLKEVYQFCDDNKMVLSAPRIGCGLAQGSWPEVEEIILRNIKVDTFIYTP